LEIFNRCNGALDHLLMRIQSARISSVDLLSTDDRLFFLP